jgi:hypothetical protein
VSKTPVFAKLLLLLCCACGGALAQTGPGDAWQPPEDRNLRHTLAAIERGFAQENLAQLGPVFPRQEKILLRWEDPVSHDGLLTGTQIILFLRDLFLRYRTATFKLQSGSLLPSGRLYHCMGRWSFTSSQGRSHKIELHFSLKQDAGIWTIRELRQTR